MAITIAIKERILRESPELARLQRQADSLRHQIQQEGPAQARVLGTDRELLQTYYAAGAIILDLLDRAT